VVKYAFLIALVLIGLVIVLTLTAGDVPQTPILTPLVVRI
jgi:hypothetical protein